MKRKTKTIIPILIITSFFIVDYFELFKVINTDGAKFVHFQFKFQSQIDGELLSEIEIKSIYKDYNATVFLQEKPTKKGIAEGHVQIPWSFKRTLFFKKSSLDNSLDDRRIDFTFICPSYREKKQTFFIKELNAPQIITLSPL